MALNRTASLGLIAFCEVAAMAVWFSASAVVPALTAEVALSALNASLFTSAVQTGFVVGTLVSAILGLADRFDARRLFFASCLVAAAANGAILLLDPADAAVVVRKRKSSSYTNVVNVVSMPECIKSSWSLRIVLS